MYKLRFRCNRPFLAVSVLVAVSVLILVIKCYPDCVMEVNLFFFAFLEVVVSMVVAYFVAENAPPSDFVRAALTVLLVTMLYGALGNLVSQTTMVLPDFAMLINYLQWIVMDIGGAVATFALYKVEPVSIYAPDSRLSGKTTEPKCAPETKSGPHLFAQSKAHMPSSASSDAQTSRLDSKEGMSASSLLNVLEKLINLKARTPKNEVLVQEITTAESEANSSQVTETTELKIEEKKSAPSPTRVVAQRKKTTSTFTKLQALSKSGTGALQKSLSGEAKEERDAEGLCSILDRLETSKFGDDELSAHSLFSGEHKVTPTDMASESERKGQTDDSPNAFPVRTTKETEHLDKSAVEPNLTNPVKPEIPLVPVVPTDKKTEPLCSEVIEPDKIDIGARLMGALSSLPKDTSLSPVVEAKLDKTQAAAVSASSETLAVKNKVSSEMDEKAETAKLPESQAYMEPSPKKSEASSVSTKVDSLTIGIVEEKETLLGSGVDGAIDDVFSNLVPQEALREVKDRVPIEEPKVVEDLTVSPQANLKEPNLVDEAGMAASEKALFDSGVDKEIEDIFSNLAPPEAQVDVSEAVLAKIRRVEEAQLSEDEAASSAQALPQAQKVQTKDPKTAPPSTQSAQSPAEVKEGSSANATTSEFEIPLTKASDFKPVQHEALREFGRLSAKSALPPAQCESTGTMKTIGKLLNEVQVVVKIIEAERTGTSFGAGLATARVVSAVKGEGIKLLLSQIDTYPEVIGSIIVGLDGLVIVSTLGEAMDKDMLGAMSVAVMGSSGLATKKLEVGQLKQMVLVSDSTITVLTDVDVGILAVFMETTAVDKIDGLLKAIHDTIHG